jgi:alkaline phosphatase D
MKKKSNLLITLFALLSLTSLESCGDPVIETTWNSDCSGTFLPINETKTITKICFGSCGAQTLPQPLLTTAANQNPDLYIFLGDNVYADTEDMETMEKEYHILCEKEEFINLKKTTPLLAVWDDHDYGYNDAGLEYPKKVEAKQVFMEFWGETNNIARMSHRGNYDAKIIGETGKKVQIILLDTRTFRSSLIAPTNSPFTYLENSDADATMLGSEQWTWLENQLLEPADIRIIASSQQFCVGYNQYEAWANFPLEQEKMYNLIASTNASGVLFISGDVHYSELSKREPSNTYPLYDITSSGITGTSTPVANTYREGTPSAINNIGMIDITWNGNASKIKMSILDESASPLLEKEITLSDIQF